jgi:hypothetical protein
MKSWLARSTVCVALGAAHAAAAQPSTSGPDAAAQLPLSDSLQGLARTHYQTATTLYENQDWAGAMAKYREAYKLSADPRLLFDVALCARDMHAYAEMQRLLRRYKQEAAATMTPEQRASVDDALAESNRLVGLLQLEVSEPGAAAAVDGEVVGETPLEEPIAIDFGTHVVIIAKPGFEPQSRDVDVHESGVIRLQVALLRLPRDGRLQIVAPSDAMIVVDRRKVARGIFDGLVALGPHAIEVTAPAKKPYEARLDLESGETRTMHVSLEDDRRTPLIWPWLAGGLLVVGGAAVGGSVLLHTRHERGPAPQGTLGSVTPGDSP